MMICMVFSHDVSGLRPGRPKERPGVAVVMRLSQLTTKMRRNHSVSGPEGRRMVICSARWRIVIAGGSVITIALSASGMGMFRRAGLSGIHLDAVFNSSPNPYVLLDRELRMVGMNKAYLAATMSSEADLIGRKMFDVFPSEPGSTHGKMLRSSFQSVFETGEVDHLPLIPYPIPGPEGSIEEHYWSATHTPIKDGDGKVSHILQHTVDVTELHRLRTISGDWKTQTNLLKRADAVQGRNRVLDEEREYLRNLF